MQAMLAAFITMNMTSIPPSKANPISRRFPPLFTLNLSEEDQIIEDLDIKRNANHDTSCIIYCMCDCSYYNTVSDFQMMSLHVFNCKILSSIFSNFGNFKR